MQTVGDSPKPITESGEPVAMLGILCDEPMTSVVRPHRQRSAFAAIQSFFIRYVAFRTCPTKFEEYVINKLMI
jgi:hypothetical protein